MEKMINRVTKYRCWDKLNNKMYHHFDLPDQYLIGLDGTFWDTKKTFQFGVDVVGVPVHDRFELMQFTGLHDKEGNEIYEGDIIETIGSDGLPVRHKIIFNDGGFAHENINYPNLSGKIRQEWISMFKVIGNSYSNPELLTK